MIHANPAARRLGITQGMRLDGARLRAPGLEVVAATEPGLVQGWRDLVRELAGWTPWLEADRRGHAYLRLDAAEAAQLAARLGARVGVADDLETAELAALAGRPGEAQTLPEGGGGAFRERLPLRFLRGVGLPERELTRLRWLGLATVGDLRALDRRPAPRLPRRHGRGVRARTCTGPAGSAWRPGDPRWCCAAPSPSSAPLFEPHELEPALDRLARSLALDLGGRAARHVTVATEGSGGALSATRVAKRPLHRAGQIRQQALFALRDSGAAATGIDALSVELAEPERVAEAAGLWDARAHRARAVDSVLERHPRALVQVRWGDPHAPAADLAWSWGALEDAARPEAARRPTRDATRAADARPSRPRSPRGRRRPRGAARGAAAVGPRRPPHRRRTGPRAPRRGPPEPPPLPRRGRPLGAPARHRPLSPTRTGGPAPRSPPRPRPGARRTLARRAPGRLRRAVRRVMAPAVVRCRDDRPVEVRWPQAAPTTIVHVTQVLDDWDYVGHWWADEVRRRYRLLEGDAGRLVEVFEEGDAWWVSRASD